jgi:hypothetical protein
MVEEEEHDDQEDNKLQYRPSQSESDIARDLLPARFAQHHTSGSSSISSQHDSPSTTHLFGYRQ